MPSVNGHRVYFDLPYIDCRTNWFEDASVRNSLLPEPIKRRITMFRHGAIIEKLLPWTGVLLSLSFVTFLTLLY